MHKKSISIIGGDLRLVYLANKLSENYTVMSAGNNHEKLSVTSVKKLPLNKTLENSELLILPIPFTKDKEHIFAPFFEEKIKIKQFMQESLQGKTIIGTAFPKEIREELQQRSSQLIDIGTEETFAIYNAIPTGEGVIQLLMAHMDRTIYGSRGLILGFGRCGFRQAKMLESLRPQLTIGARNPSQLALARAEGYQTVELEKIQNNLEQYDFIINTIPAMVLDEEVLFHCSSPLLVIDIANQMASKIENNCQWINARGIPGTYAPKSAAEIIYQVLMEKGWLS